jgi:hypothetical protein
MSFNIPITVNGDVSTDGITRPNGYGSLELGSVLDLTSVYLALNENGDVQDKRCAACEEEMDPDNPTAVLGGDDKCLDTEDGTHDPEWLPLSWAQNVVIEVDEEQDMITLSLAHAEPRGGWSMRFWRNQENGQILMSLPHEGMNEPHASMRKISESTYEVG